METTTPTELLDLKARLDQWRATRQHSRQRLPDELRQEALKLSRRYQPTLVRRVLNLDPWRLDRVQATKKPSADQPPLPTFFQLPIETPGSAALPTGLSGGACRLELERRDGSRLRLTLPTLDLASTRQICADFLRGRKP
jgi:hypothetical protein